MRFASCAFIRIATTGSRSVKTSIFERVSASAVCGVTLRFWESICGYRKI
jgi:hypothetical protein